MNFRNDLAQTELTVAQLVISRPQALSVFNKYNIDYCCGGKRSLNEACSRIGLDPRAVLAEVEHGFVEGQTGAIRPDSWSSSLLVDYIIANHHDFVRTAIPELEGLLDKVCERHGHDNPNLLRIRQSFLELANDLLVHMNKEELALFPAIKRLALMLDNTPLRKIIQTPIAAMEDDHSLAGELIQGISALSDNYTPPSGACMTFQLTYQKLREFQNDLMMHVHLENNILFPRFANTEEIPG